MKLFIPLLTAGGLAVAMPAAAQTNQQQSDQQGPAAMPSEGCQAKPDQDQNKSAGNDSSETGTGTNLTEKLDNCNGVLKPPPTGDAELTEPAPDQGKTPVIKPGEVPPQPAK